MVEILFKSHIINYNYLLNTKNIYNVIIFKSLFLPRVAEFIYIGDNKIVCLLLEL